MFAVKFKTGSSLGCRPWWMNTKSFIPILFFGNAKSPTRKPNWRVSTSRIWRPRLQTYSGRSARDAASPEGRPAPPHGFNLVDPRPFNSREFRIGLLHQHKRSGEGSQELYLNEQRGTQRWIRSGSDRHRFQVRQSDGTKLWLDAVRSSPLSEWSSPPIPGFSCQADTLKVGLWLFNMLQHSESYFILLIVVVTKWMTGTTNRRKYTELHNVAVVGSLCWWQWSTHCHGIHQCLDESFFFRAFLDF